MVIKPEERRRIYWTMVSVDTLAWVEGELSTICSRAIEMAQWTYRGSCGDPSITSFSTIENGPFMARCGFEFHGTEVAYAPRWSVP